MKPSHVKNLLMRMPFLLFISFPFLLSVNEDDKHGSPKFTSIFKLYTRYFQVLRFILDAPLISTNSAVTHCTFAKMMSLQIFQNKKTNWYMLFRFLLVLRIKQEVKPSSSYEDPEMSSVIKVTIVFECQNS